MVYTTIFPQDPGKVICFHRNWVGTGRAGFKRVVCSVRLCKPTKMGYFTCHENLTEKNDGEHITFHQPKKKAI